MIVAAVIFDLNGTVLKDEYVFGKSFAKVLRRLGAEVYEKYPHVGGIGVKENWPILFKKYNISVSEDIDELTREVVTEYLDNLDEVKIRGGFAKLNSSIREAGILSALATSSEWWMAEKVFEKLRLPDYFDVITTGDEVLYKKPDPTIFIETAKKMSVEPEECVVVEDAVSGIEAAMSAKMKSVGIARDIEHAKELSKANLVVSGFEDLDISDLYKL